MLYALPHLVCASLSAETIACVLTWVVPECLAVADNDQQAFLTGFGWVATTPRKRAAGQAATINWNNTEVPDKDKSIAAHKLTEEQVRVQLIGRFKPCTTEIYLHIVARMAD